jgi:hypothetical protein
MREFPIPDQGWESYPSHPYAPGYGLLTFWGWVCRACVSFALISPPFFGNKHGALILLMNML